MVKNQFSKKTFFDLDLKWIDDIKINLSAVERRTTSLTKRRTVKKEYQVAWLLKSITLLDLTTLSGDDTFGKVDRLCQKALQPISLNILTAIIGISIIPALLFLIVLVTNTFTIK